MIRLRLFEFLSTDAVVLVPSCSFPYTYNGGLYYRCIENIANVSTAEQPLACINVNYTPAACNSPGWWYSLLITTLNYSDFITFLCNSAKYTVILPRQSRPFYQSFSRTTSSHAILPLT